MAPSSHSHPGPQVLQPEAHPMHSMRFNTFISLVLAAVLLVACGLGVWVYRAVSKPSASVGPVTPMNPPPSESSLSVSSGGPVTSLVADSPGRAPSSGDPDPAAVPRGPSPSHQPDLTLSDIDRLALSFRGATVHGSKAKDVTKGRPFKIDLYQDSGSVCNRLKIDLDRDGKWDEKWTFDGQKVKRQVSPADNEQYTLEYRLDGEGWRKK